MGNYGPNIQSPQQKSEGRKKREKWRGNLQIKRELRLTTITVCAPNLDSHSNKQTFKNR